MNINDAARVARLQELATDEALAKQKAIAQAQEYVDKFNKDFSAMEIRRAGERAHWINIVFPLIKCGKGICSA